MTTGIDYSVSQNMRFNDTIRINGSKYSRMDQVKFFKGCLTHVLHLVDFEYLDPNEKKYSRKERAQLAEDSLQSFC